MDLAQLGIDAGLIAGIVGLTQAFKWSLGLRKAQARWLVVVPMMLGIMVAIFRADPRTVGQIISEALKYGGGAAWFYVAGKKISGKGIK